MRYSVFFVIKEQKSYMLFKLTLCIKSKYFFDKNITSGSTIIVCY